MYDIYLNNQIVGYATIAKQGLYYTIRCVCDMEREKIYRVFLKTKDSCINLGIFVPEGNKFVLSKMIAAKHISNENINFSVQVSDRFSIPLFNGCECDCLDTLETARLDITNGQFHLIINRSQDR